MAEKTAVFVALGGNALLKPHELCNAADQFAIVERTCTALATVVESGHPLVISHGNGPQVGSLLIQNDDARRDVPPMPLDVLGAESQGQIGYMLQQGMANELARRGVVRPVVTVLTQTLVRADDPAFGNPTKPVGPFYTAAEADVLTRDKKWDMCQTSDGWRRVVPSPDPIEVVEAGTIAAMVASGCVVIAVGGGGVPVVATERGLAGVEAVVDKDLASERLATAMRIRDFLILTTVRHVMKDYGTPSEIPLASLAAAEARELMRQGQFSTGSMGPKVLSAVRFVEGGGQRAVIAHLDEIDAALEGAAGTRFLPL